MQFNFNFIFKAKKKTEKVCVLQYHEKINTEDMSLEKSISEMELLCN